VLAAVLNARSQLLRFMQQYFGEERHQHMNSIQQNTACCHVYLRSTAGWQSSGWF
jgi:hypothetical protein